MRLNTTESLRFAGEVRAKYGTWQDAIAASRLVDGVYVVGQPPKARPDDEDRIGDPIG